MTETERIAKGWEDAARGQQLRNAAPELLAALQFIVNDTPEPGEDARLTTEGYNKACAAIERATKPVSAAERAELLRTDRK